MIIGDTSSFAIESNIAQAYERLSFRGLGLFVLHIGGNCYGVKRPDATMLGAAFDEVRRIIRARGNHTVPFASEKNAGDIVDSIGEANYNPDTGRESFFGLSIKQFRDIVYSSHCGWHWACDEAFDDGSSVWHFDVMNRVRLIADEPKDKNDYHHSPEALRDIWLEADLFYGVLQEWQTAFEAEWKAAPKISESDDKAESSLH